MRYLVVVLIGDARFPNDTNHTPIIYPGDETVPFLNILHMGGIRFSELNNVNQLQVLVEVNQRTRKWLPGERCI